MYTNGWTSTLSHMLHLISNPNLYPSNSLICVTCLHSKFVQVTNNHIPSIKIHMQYTTAFTNSFDTTVIHPCLHNIYLVIFFDRKIAAFFALSFFVSFLSSDFCFFFFLDELGSSFLSSFRFFSGLRRALPLLLSRP